MMPTTPMPWKKGRFVPRRGNLTRCRAWKAAEALVEAHTIRGAGKPGTHAGEVVAKFTSTADRDAAMHRMTMHDKLVDALVALRGEYRSGRKPSKKTINRVDYLIRQAAGDAAR